MHCKQDVQYVCDLCMTSSMMSYDVTNTLLQYCYQVSTLIYICTNIMAILSVSTNRSVPLIRLIVNYLQRLATWLIEIVRASQTFYCY